MLTPLLLVACTSFWDVVVPLLDFVRFFEMCLLKISCQSAIFPPGEGRGKVVFFDAMVHKVFVGIPGRIVNQGKSAVVLGPLFPPWLLPVHRPVPPNVQNIRD